MSETFDGGCTCGAVRYRLLDRPMWVNCCHCTWCQTETGSAFVINAVIEADRVALLRGAPEPVVVPTASGRGQTIWRCPRCHVALWSHYAGAGPRIDFVRVGTLDKPGAHPPGIHIFTSTRLPWFVLPDGVPSSDGYYDLAAIWPAAALERRRAAQAG